MYGYNVIYRKRKGCFHSVIVGRPIAGFELSPDVEEKIVRMFFQQAHPSWTVIVVTSGDYSDSSAFVDVTEI